MKILKKVVQTALTEPLLHRGLMMTITLRQERDNISGELNTGTIGFRAVDQKGEEIAFIPANRKSNRESLDALLNPEKTNPKKVVASARGTVWSSLVNGGWDEVEGQSLSASTISSLLVVKEFLAENNFVRVADRTEQIANAIARLWALLLEDHEEVTETSALPKIAANFLDEARKKVISTPIDPETGRRKREKVEVEVSTTERTKIVKKKGPHGPAEAPKAEEEKKEEAVASKKKK